MKYASFQIYNTISEFYVSIGIDFNQEADVTIHATADLMPQYPDESPLFRTNYYSIVFIEKGRGSYIIDGDSYETRENTIYFTNPGHIKGFRVSEPYKGHIVTFSETFLREYVHESAFEEFPFLIAESAPPTYMQHEEFAPFKLLCEQMLREYQSGASVRFKIVGSLLNVLLLKMKESIWNAYDPQHEGDQGSQIVSNFRKNLTSYFRDMIDGDNRNLPQVADLASMQGLHPNYFSTVIKLKTGKSATVWVTEKMIAEARALLRRSDVSIKEISYKLAFKEPTHFSRYFKKHTGETPGEFRRQNSKS